MLRVRPSTTAPMTTTTALTSWRRRKSRSDCRWSRGVMSHRDERRVVPSPRTCRLMSSSLVTDPAGPGHGVGHILLPAAALAPQSLDHAGPVLVAAVLAELGLALHLLDEQLDPDDRAQLLLD